MNVTVFGGSQAQPGEPAYLEALHLGALLAQAGHTVLTGGYVGVMEAVSRGAAEAGGHVIGATCQEIEAWRTVRANPWVQEEWHYASLRERLSALIDHCQAAMALPGGVGTLVEIAMTWNLLIVEALTPRPLIVIGPAWKQTLTDFLTYQGKYVPEKDRHWLIFVNTVEEAVEVLNGENGNG